MGVGPLAHFRYVSSRLDNTKVAAFIQDGQWNMEMIMNTAPFPKHVSSILATQLHIQEGVSDRAVWKPNADGVFF